MTQTKIHIQDSGRGVGEESAQWSKEEEIKQVCVVSIHTLSRWILYKLFLCVDTIVRIEASSEAKVEERKRYAKCNGRCHTSCSDWQ